MLVSKNPYVTEPRQNLSPKKPHFTLKTGENLTQNLLLKTLIFIVEKYGKKLLSFAIYNMGNYHNVKNKYRLLVDTHKILCNFVL